MRRFRSGSVAGFPLLCLNNRIPYLTLQEPLGSPKFSTLLFLHARRSDPDRPSGISPCQYLRAKFVFSVLCLVSRQCHGISLIILTIDSSVLASSKDNSVAICFNRLNEAVIASGWCGHPSGLQDALCTLHPCCSRLLQYPYRWQRYPSEAQHSIRVGG